METSLSKRYFYKLYTNFINFLSGFISAALIPRALGAEVYGNFSFIQNFYIRIATFFDMGTSNALYNKLAQRLKEFSLVSFYLKFCVLALLILTFFSCLIIWSGLKSIIFPGQNTIYIFMGLVWCIGFFLDNIFRKLMDAYGWTTDAEIARMAIRLISVLILLILFYLKILDLLNYFLYLYLIYFSFVIATFIIFNKRNYSLFAQNWRLSKKQKQAYIKEFYNYSHPLFTLQVIVMLAGIIERWMLQKFAGSTAQGFYGFAFRISQICILFTGAMTPLLMREFSIAFSQNNIKKMSWLFRRYIPLLYSISAFFSCFIAVNVKAVINLVGGSEYKQAIIPVIIMAFFPMHQTYGYLAGSLFLATSKTNYTRNIGIASTVLGIILAFFLIAPKELYGLSLNATGLAIKNVTIQFLGVNLQLYLISKYLKYSYIKYLAHQFISVIILFIACLLGNYIASKVIADYVFQFIISGFIYTTIITILVIIAPKVFGLKKKDLRNLFRKLRKKVS